MLGRRHRGWVDHGRCDHPRDIRSVGRIPMSADKLIPGDDISCDGCGEMTREWDWTPAYDRFCIECLARLDDADPRADRGCFEYHQRAGQ